MIVTDKNYSMDKRLVKFADLISRRLTIPSPKWDYPLLVDGYEGYGKTNIGAGVAYYVAQKTGREFNLNNIIFDPDEMVRYAINNENRVIMWDEAALAALAMQGNTAIQIAIVQMLMIARKKRHFFIINIPRFYRLKEPIIERCMGMLHVYSRNELEIGRFTFYRKQSLDALWEEWKRSRRKPNYKKFVTCRGTFSEALPLIVDEKAYDAKKDIAITSILQKLKGGNKSKERIELTEFKRMLSKIRGWPITSQDDLAKRLGINRTTLLSWQNLAKTGENPTETTEIAKVSSQNDIIKSNTLRYVPLDGENDLEEPEIEEKEDAIP